MTKEVTGSGSTPTSTPSEAERQDSRREKQASNPDLERKADQFSELLKRGDEPKRRTPGESGDLGLAAEAARRLGAGTGPGDTILAGMLGGAERPAADGALITTELTAKIVDRLAVGTDPATGTSMVSLHLAGDARTEGTEIMLFREQGELHVRLVAPDAAKQAFFGTLQDGLQAALSTRLDERRVHVEVTTQGGADDGRSRGRRDVAEEWEPE